MNFMGTRICLVMVLFCSVLISACAAVSTTPDRGLYEESLSLDKWMEYEAVPYLIKELGEHPMFKNQPFLLVSMKRDNVESEIDDLTMQLREEIIDGLLTKSGISLAWRPSMKRWKHHTSLDEMECINLRKERFYVGLDVGISSVDEKLYVKIRALNLQENKWVTGFGISWKGKATNRQKEALNRKKTDDFLLGLRPLPFNSKQADLLASYLAKNLSCLFKKMERKEAVVFVEQKNFADIKYFKYTGELIKKYLAKFRETIVTDDQNSANIIVSTKVQNIYKGLYQVWVTARYKKGEKYLPGTGTEAYVFLLPDKTVESDQNVKNIKIKTQPAAKPADGNDKANVKDQARLNNKVNINDIDLCFYDFADGFEFDIYPLLKKSPGIISVRRLYDVCSNQSKCLCYELTVKAVHSGTMEALIAWLGKNLQTSGMFSYKMIPKSETRLEIRFSRGFE